MQAIIPRIVRALLEEFFLSVLEFLSETASIVVSVELYFIIFIPFLAKNLIINKLCLAIF